MEINWVKNRGGPEETTGEIQSCVKWKLRRDHPCWASHLHMRQLCHSPTTISTIPFAYKETVSQEIMEILENRIIEPSMSEWTSPVVLIEMKDNTIWLCVDYRKLNSISKPNAYLMPQVNDIIDEVGRAKYISALDLTKGYWLVPVNKHDRPKTAFVTPLRLYQFHRMPFG